MAVGVPAKDSWLETVLRQENRAHSRFFGREFNLAAFQTVLERYGLEAVQQWKELGLEPHFLPAVSFQDTDFPGWETKLKLSDWYCQKIAEGRILRRQSDGSFIPDSLRLEGIAVLVDVRLKPMSGKMFKKDNLLGPIIADLRREKKIAAYEYGPQSSRFGISGREWKEQVVPALAEFLEVRGMSSFRVRLETPLEANVIPQMYHLPRRSDGETDGWSRYEGYFLDSSGRCKELGGGNVFLGGLAEVRYIWVSSHFCRLAVRPIIVLS